MFEIELTVKSALEEPACQILEEAGAEGCAIYGRSDPLSEDEIWDEMDYSLPAGMCKVVGYTDCENIELKAEEIKNRIEQFKTFGLDFEHYGLEIREIMDINWAEEHKKYYQTIIVDDIAVVPVWDTESINNLRHSKLIILEPGAAFGTGIHETTKMCMRLLNKFVRRGDIVYDIGCGSGILSILASVLGADKVISTDIDDIAVSAAKKNAALNGLSNIEIKKGSLPDACYEKADVIVANIIAPVLKKLIPDLKKYLCKNKILILSGILPDQAKEIKKILEENNMKPEANIQQGDWISIAAAVEV